MVRFKEIVSEEPNNKDQKNQPKGCRRSSRKGVTRKRYFKHAEYQQTSFWSQHFRRCSTLSCDRTPAKWLRNYHV